jgi:hypothetical protein
MTAPELSLTVPVITLCARAMVTLPTRQHNHTASVRDTRLMDLVIANPRTSQVTVSEQFKGGSIFERAY